MRKEGGREGGRGWESRKKRRGWDKSSICGNWEGGREG